MDERRGGAVGAEVRGSASYSVKLWAEGPDLAYACTCPRGDDGEFCKHCVAVGLAVLAGTTKPPKQSERKSRVGLDDVRQYLGREDKAVLVELLMERAQWDETLRDQVFLRTAKNRRKGGVDVESLKEAIDGAIDPGDFLGWDEIGEYANGVEEAVDTIAAVLKEGHAAQTIELAEHALGTLERAMGSLHDSDGEMSRFLQRLEELHRAACVKARPDPVKLAKRLLEREMSSEYDVFRGAVIGYASVLGKDGVAEYRRLACERWSKVPAAGPGQRGPDHYGARSRISSIMTALARMDADVEAEVDVLRRDLSRADAFLKVAKVYREAGRSDAALEWAEKGLTAFADRADPRLREFVAEEYHRRKRHDEAMALVWTAFSQSPQVEAYRDLKRHGDRGRSWASWRKRAWKVLCDKVESRKRETARSSIAVADHSLLVEVLLWEGDVKAAWNEARSGGCSETLWMVLAERREKEHPADAVPIYQRHVQLTLRDAHKDAYADAVKLLKRVRQAMVSANDSELFGDYLGSIRSAHARKRNFIRLLDRANWR